MVTIEELDPELPHSEKLLILSSIARKEGNTQEADRLAAAGHEARAKEYARAEEARWALGNDRGRER